MDPSENEIWTDFNGIEKHIKTCIEKNKSPLCWQKTQRFVFRIFYSLVVNLMRKKRNILYKKTMKIKSTILLLAVLVFVQQQKKGRY
jgi:hypothetical protein